MRDRWLLENEARATLVELGFDGEDWKLWRRKWRDLRGNANLHGRKCLLTFRQYMKLAKRADVQKPHQIGKSKGKFQMGRIGDVGNYEWGNCRFIPMEQNLAERASNGGNIEIGRKLARMFKVTSPRWNTYIGDNLKRFCRRYGLDYSCMKAVCGGKKEHHKGWVGSYA